MEVLMFRELSEECLCTKGTTFCAYCFDNQRKHSLECYTKGCHGTGRVPKEAHLETVLDALRKADYWVSLTRVENPKTDMQGYVVDVNKTVDQGGSSYNPNPLLATLQAALQAAEAMNAGG